MDPTCQQGIVQAGGVSVMVWDVCSWRDMGPMILLDSTLIGDRYPYRLQLKLLDFKLKRRERLEDGQSPLDTPYYSNSFKLGGIDKIAQESKNLLGCVGGFKCTGP
ncbi:hypothetical protein TNCV_3983911 [Trichonephila clavipes]|nr:hypothetical protein TNCV_3983911 [Trichonephila clavipes]